MFSFTIVLKQFKLGGINALDTRRRLKLGDGVKLEMHQDLKKTFDVDENFARKHFDPNKAEEAVYMDVGQLGEGDIKLVKYDKIEFAFSFDRAKELFILLKKQETIRSKESDDA